MQERQSKNGSKYYLASLEELEALSPLEPIEGRDNLRLGCPFHGSDKQHSLAVSLSQHSFKCYCCGAWGYLSDETSTHSVNIPSPKPVIKDRPDLRKLLEQWKICLKDSPGAEYLAHRHIKLETALSYGLTFCPQGQWPGRLEARKWPRIVFPLDTPDGELIGLYSRAIDPDYPRAKAPKEIRHDIVGQRGLFNGCKTLKLIRSQPVLYLTEGTFDCLAMLESGFAATVALVGIEGLPWKLFKDVRQLYLCLDRDDSGITKAHQQAKEATMRGITAFIPGEDTYGGYSEPSEQYEATGHVTLGNNPVRENHPEPSDTTVKDIQKTVPSVKYPAPDSTPELLRWASELAKKGLELVTPVTFAEATLRPITTGRVSYYSKHYLETIYTARFQQKVGGWGQWTSQWWQEREAETKLALTQLREALEDSDGEENK